MIGRDIIDKIKSNQSVLIAFFELIVGAVLLTLEFRDFIGLLTRAEADKMFDGLVDFAKYRENTYCLLYLWSILLFTGSSYWINVKLHWVFNQILLITLLLAAMFELIVALYFTLHILSVIVCLAVLFVMLFVFLRIWNRMYRESYLKTIGIRSYWKKWFSVCLGVISSTIYFILKTW